MADLCCKDTGALALVLNGYKAHLRERGLASASLNRQLAAVPSAAEDGASVAQAG